MDEFLKCVAQKNKLNELSYANNEIKEFEYDISCEADALTKRGQELDFQSEDNSQILALIRHFDVSSFCIHSFYFIEPDLYGYKVPHYIELDGKSYLHIGFEETRPIGVDTVTHGVVCIEVVSYRGF